MGTPKMRYAVKRLRWAEDPYEETTLTRQPGEVTVASFDSPDDAEADRRKREHAARQKANPFTHGPSVFYWTHLDEPRLRDWLQDHGITPPKAPKSGKTNWAAWWKKNQAAFSAEQQTAVWDALDKVRFFAVAHEPVRSVGYAVVMVNWRYNDENFSANDEGGQVTKVFRTRERADRECAAQNEAAAAVWNEQVADMGFDEDEDEEFRMPAFDMSQRLAKRGVDVTRRKKGQPPVGEYMTADGVPFYEVIEVELEGLE